MLPKEKLYELILKSKENYFEAKNDLNSFLKKFNLKFTKSETIKIKNILIADLADDSIYKFSQELKKGINILDMADVSFFK